MRTSRVVIEILPTRVDVVVYDGRRRVSGRRLPVELESEPRAWMKDIRNLAPTLRTIIQELEATNAKTTVLYRTPTQAVDLADLAIKSPSEACEAAKLGVFDTLAYSDLAAVCQAMHIAQDRQGEQRKRHVVVAADRDDIAQSIVHLVESAGLRFAHAVPVDAAITARLVREALADSEKSQTPRGMLYIGEYSSMFVVACGGGMILSRRIGLGVDLLASSLTRPIRVEDQSKPITLTHEESRRILHHHGLPARDAIVHKDTNLKGANVIPVIQPMLQRFLVELRQSLRFGVTEEMRDELHVTLLGPGSAVPNLGALIGEELGITVQTRSTTEEYQTDVPGCLGSEIDDALVDERTLEALNLQPAERSQKAAAARFKRLILAGAAAALLVVGFDGIRLGAQMNTARQHAEALAQKSATDDVLRLTEGRLLESMQAMAKLERVMEEEAGRRVDLRAIMHELSLIVPPTMRFTGMAFTRESQGMVGRISGFAEVVGEQAHTTELHGFIQRLRQSPLFDSVVLGDVHAASMGRSTGERFEIVLNGSPLVASLPGIDPIDQPTNIAGSLDDQLPASLANVQEDER